MSAVVVRTEQDPLHRDGFFRVESRKDKDSADLEEVISANGERFGRKQSRYLYRKQRDIHRHLIVCVPQQHHFLQLP